MNTFIIFVGTLIYLTFIILWIRSIKKQYNKDVDTVDNKELIEIIKKECIDEFKKLNPKDEPLPWCLLIGGGDKNVELCKQAAILKLKYDVGKLENNIVGKITNEAVYEFIYIKNCNNVEDGLYLIALLQSRFGEKNENN